MQLQARLIDDLLDLTRITRGKLQLHLEPVDANALVRDAIEIAHSAIAAKNLKVSTQLNAKVHQILADSIRIQQVFWNLINNAVKFTSPGGQIRRYALLAMMIVSFISRLLTMELELKRERLASLFTPFEQADPSVSRQFGGLGLGLAITKRLVNLHDGTIQADSRGRSFGATFKVTLNALARRNPKTLDGFRRPQKHRKVLTHFACGRSPRYATCFVAFAYPLRSSGFSRGYHAKRFQTNSIAKIRRNLMRYRPS